MEVDSERADGAVGPSVGAMTTPGEVSRAVNGLPEVWRKGGGL
jgi:hypothetical protein